MTTYEKLIDSLRQDEIDDLEVRAAILEFDAGLTRSEAEEESMCLLGYIRRQKTPSAALERLSKVFSV